MHYVPGTYPEFEDRRSPMTLTVSGPHQDENGFEKAYNIRYYKGTQHEGEGDDDEAPPSRKPRLDGESADTPANNAGQPGTSCAGPKGCNLSKNYRCASDQNIPPDSPWGTFVCTLIPNVATAVASYLALGGCRGRCLLDDINGTDSGDTAIAPVLQTDLKCPCNCTYVTSECCISSNGIVHESLDFRYNATMRPQDGNICCDEATGEWRNSTELRDNDIEDPACPAETLVSFSSSGLRLT